jgi:hypothetical protein
LVAKDWWLDLATDMVGYGRLAGADKDRVPVRPRMLRRDLPSRCVTVASAELSAGSIHCISPGMSPFWAIVVERPHRRSVRCREASKCD